MEADTRSAGTSASSRLSRVSLLDVLLRRRARRFGKGQHLDGGPLTFRSNAPPQPLSLDEQAALAFAACGITGYALGDLPYQQGIAPESGGGNIMINFVARTVPSGDAAHCVTLFVIDDSGAWILKRPQDYSRADIPELVAAAREHRLVDLYERARVRIANDRLDPPREVPYTLSFNKWSGNQPGSTVFLPVAELTALAINATLAAFSEENGYYLLDEANNYRPAGIAKFARSRGGHLYDDPAMNRVATVAIAEAWLYEFAAIEQGAMLQNLALMVEALGLGGFPYFAAHPSIWPQTLGFRMETLPFTRTIGAHPAVAWLLRALKRDIPVPTAIGFEHNGSPLIRPFCPPYYPNMEAAVLAFVDYKCGAGGTQRDTFATGWGDSQAVQAGIPRPSDAAIEATITCCDYLYRRYGRFPRSSGPFRTVLAYQAHHLDDDFYRQFYRTEAFMHT